MQFTPEQRKMFPESIGVVTIQDSAVSIYNKKRLYIDASAVPWFIDDINKNDFVFMQNYGTSVHKFHIETIRIADTKDEHRTDISNIKTPKANTSLSLNDTLKCLQNSQKTGSLMMQ